MSLTEPDVSISDIRLFSRTHGRSRPLCLAVRAFWRRAVFGSVPDARLRNPLRSTANPFEWAAARAGHYPGYASTMSWSDCHAAVPPPHLFGLLEASPGERHGSPKFRCRPLDNLPWTQTPARRAALALTRVTLLASGP